MNSAPKAIGLFVPRRLVALAGCLLCCANGLGAQYVKGRMIPEVRLKNGTLLHDFTVVAVGTTTIVAKWDGGKGSVLLSQLPEEMRADLAAAVPVKPPPPKDIAPPVAPIDPQLASAELPTEIKLTNGFVMHKSRVKRWEANSVLVSYQGGIVSVRFANITPAQRVIFEARKDEALARQTKEDANLQAGSGGVAQEDEARKAAEAQAKEDADKRAEEVSKGVSFHYLVKGMSKDEVKQAYGRPVDDHGDVFLYPSRGHDRYGNSADRMLTFRDGALIGWRDQRDGEPDGAVEH